MESGATAPGQTAPCQRGDQAMASVTPGPSQTGGADEATQKQPVGGDGIKEQGSAPGQTEATQKPSAGIDGIKEQGSALG
jgi:hypothetical protein